ncbi:phage capsid protein [Streptomyces sp. R302]|uniref:phage capsid protein n=1 Tax=unclassified Streptomyces TaxID=2593676 RepID=UPI00145CC672|nr:MULTISPECIES: phage capsid protein [unclassified Streptomyces]NML50549.1 phage capsid protein [Streptomyces sp. R301]NML79540.1 phage capsid protein [Streptomyces sp. R302]
MALPENGAPWPPPEWAPVYAQMRVDDAWYSGDKRRLAAVYEHAPQPNARRNVWGRRSVDHAAPERDRRLHVPLPGDIAATSADLLFADMPAITVDSTETQTRLDELLDLGRVQQVLLSAGEQAAAMSGVYLRSTWDRAVAPDRPLLTVVQPDRAVPEFFLGILRAVTFWQELSGSTLSTVWRHMERHAPGEVEHALYEGTPDNVGRRVPLTEHPVTRALVDSLDLDGSGATGATVSTGIQQLTASYVPNMLPNRLYRGSPLGRSDYGAPLYDQFASLDEVWTSWMRDILLARARLIVPRGYLRDDGPGRGATFDLDREVYDELNMPPNEGSGITLSQFAIRVEEHQRSAEAIMRQAAQSAGYSAQSFGLEGGGQPITATESESRDQRSMVTRRKKAGYFRYGIAEQALALLALDNAHFGRRNDLAAPVTVDFGDGVAESEQQTAITLDLLKRAESASAATRVKILHPDWDDTAVKAEVAAILAETGAAAPDPVGTFPMG